MRASWRRHILAYCRAMLQHAQPIRLLLDTGSSCACSMRTGGESSLHRRPSCSFLLSFFVSVPLPPIQLFPWLLARSGGLVSRTLLRAGAGRRRCRQPPVPPSPVASHADRTLRSRSAPPAGHAAPLCAPNRLFPPIGVPPLTDSWAVGLPCWIVVTAAPCDARSNLFV